MKRIVFIFGLLAMTIICMAQTSSFSKAAVDTLQEGEEIILRLPSIKKTWDVNHGGIKFHVLEFYSNQASNPCGLKLVMIQSINLSKRGVYSVRCNKFNDRLYMELETNRRSYEVAFYDDVFVETHKK